MSGTRCLIVVWDGFRPSDMSRELTPQLVALAQAGTTFVNSRCAYPSLTRVNCASLICGSRPSVHGIVGNLMYLPAIDPGKASTLASAAVVRALAQARGGHLFGGCPSLGEVLAGNGLDLAVVSAASPGSTTIIGWGARITVGDGVVEPDSARRYVDRFGPSPGRKSPNTTALNHYIAAVACDEVIPRLSPDVVLVWLGEPDASQHYTGIRTPETLAAIQANDRILADLVSAVGADCDIIVTSDHAHTPVNVQPEHTKDVLERGTGLRDGRDFILASDGVHLLVPATEAVVRGVIAALRGTGTVGAVFTRDPHPDAMPMSEVHIGGPWAPDVKYSHLVGEGDEVLVGAECAYRATHGSISGTDMGNLLVAAGPTFRSAETSSVPCGIVDIAPTVTEILGLGQPEQWQGRPLREAFNADSGGDNGAGPQVVTCDIEHESVHPLGRTRQSVQRRRVGDTMYVMSGSAVTQEAEAGAVS